MRGSGSDVEQEFPVLVRRVAELRARLQTWRDAGDGIALVPTMGALHAGHLALIRQAKTLASRVIVSIFVNPRQFGPQEDFARYPRQEAQDVEQAIGAEEYLAISTSSLVRMFDFTLLKRDQFMAWPDIPEVVHEESDRFFYRQRHCGDCAYTRGVQIISPRRAEAKIYQDVIDGWRGERDKQYVEFLAYDWRNQRLAKISTDPKATTNYFVTEGNNKPFELSPAFFRAGLARVERPADMVSFIRHKVYKPEYSVGATAPTKAA
jgi:cytidyltransferase-like protein